MLRHRWMIGGYAFEGNPNDIVGSFNGTAVNTPTYPTGKVGKAIEFDGTNQHVTVGSGLLNNMSQGTITAWIYRDVTNVLHTIIDKTQTGAANYCQFMIASNAGGDAGGNANKLRATINNSTNFYGNTAIAINTWYRVALTWNGSTHEFFINAVSDGSASRTETVPNVSRTIGIGVTDPTGTPGAYMNGKNDELIVWDRKLSIPNFQRDLLGLSPI